MPQRAHIDQPAGQPSYDGAPRCSLCAAGGDFSDTDWCMAAESLVCEHCCRHLISGDRARIVSMAANTGRSMTEEGVWAHCLTCPRAHRRFAERALTDQNGDTPAC
jgi:hypothetical protein